jgi:hypothetical protein
MSLLEHAKREIEIMKLLESGNKQDGDGILEEYAFLVYDSAYELVKKFSEQGHSGMSANLTLNIYKKLANYEPLSKLTGVENEWREWTTYGSETDNPSTSRQNKRCSRIFQEKDGDTYIISHYIFREPSGCCWTNGIRKNITFPYALEKEIYIDVPNSDVDTKRFVDEYEEGIEIYNKIKGE